MTMAAIIMFSLNSVLQSLHPSKLASNIATNYTKIKDRIMPPLPVSELLPNLFHIDYPQKHHASQLIEHIGSANYLICNIGEYEYEDDLPKLLLQRNPNGRMQHLNFQLYGNLPFEELIQAISDIQQALRDQSHVYVHCQEGRMRSAAFLASYLFMTEGKDISEAIHQVNKKLGINLESSSTLYKNQHTLFKNLVNYHNDRNFINKNRLQLQRVAITNAPSIKPKDANNKTQLIEVQVVLEVRCGPEIVHKCAYKDSVSSGDSVCLDLAKAGKTVAVGDEFLIIVKYLHKQTLYNVMRIQLNTNFIFNNFARVHQHDVDLSGFCLPQKTGTFIDLTFKEDPSHSKLSQIGKRTSKVQPGQKKENWDLLSGEGVTDSQLHTHEDQFEWLQEQPEIDEQQLNSKIEEVMKNMNRKEEERGEDRQSEDEEEDFDDYLGKLESQA